MSQVARRLCLVIGLASLLATGRGVVAADEPTISVEFKDGVLTPSRVEVPANQRFRLELKNAGTTPAEFESSELKKEKVLAPGTTSSLIFRTLEAGEHPFFDDFHPEAKGVLVAK
jgi:hypothetical protein